MMGVTFLYINNETDGGILMQDFLRLFHVVLIKQRQIKGDVVSLLSVAEIVS